MVLPRLVLPVFLTCSWICGALSAPAQNIPKNLMEGAVEYPDSAAFERAAISAASYGMPESLLKIARAEYYVLNGNGAQLKTLLPSIESSRADLLAQKFDPMSTAQLDKLLEGVRLAVQTYERDPARFARICAEKKKRAQGEAILKDLRMVDAGCDQYAIENNKRDGEPIPAEAWMKYQRVGRRLQRTGADVFGNAYGPQKVGTNPVVSKASYARIADTVSPDFFAPYQIER